MKREKLALGAARACVRVVDDTLEALADLLARREGRPRDKPSVGVSPPLPQLLRLPPSDLTAEDALGAWLGHLRDERLRSAHTVRAYGYWGRAYVAFVALRRGGSPLKAADLATVQAADVRAFLADRKEKAGRDLSAKTIMQTVTALRSFHGWLSGRLDVADVQVELARRARPARARPTSLTTEQVKALIKASVEDRPRGPPAWARFRDAAMLILLYGCGLRISEALSLRRGDVPLPDVLRVGKKSKVRLVSVIPAVREAVEAYAAAVPFQLADGDLLFRTERNTPVRPRYAQSMVEDLRSRLGLPEAVTPDTLSKSLATHLLPGGADLREIQELLGQGFARAIQTYGEVNDNRLLDVDLKRAGRSRLRGA